MRKNQVSILRMLHIMSQPERFQIVQKLRKLDKPMAFSEIKKWLEEENNRKYPDGVIWNHLRVLIDSKCLKRKLKIKINPATRRTTITSYALTDMGKIVSDRMEEILKIGSSQDPFFINSSIILFS